MTQTIQYLEFKAVSGSWGGPEPGTHSVKLVAAIPYSTPESPNMVYSAKLEMAVSPDLYHGLMEKGCSFPMVLDYS